MPATPGTASAQVSRLQCKLTNTRTSAHRVAHICCCWEVDQSVADEVLGYFFFFFFESQHGDMSSDGNMLVHGVSVDATPRYVYLHGEWRMLLI